MTLTGKKELVEELKRVNGYDLLMNIKHKTNNAIPTERTIVASIRYE